MHFLDDERCDSLGFHVTGRRFFPFQYPFLLRVIDRILYNPCIVSEPRRIVCAPLAEVCHVGYFQQLVEDRLSRLERHSL